MRWGFDPNAYLVGADADDMDDDVIGNSQRLAFGSGQAQHEGFSGRAGKAAAEVAGLDDAPWSMRGSIRARYQISTLHRRGTDVIGAKVARPGTP
jgi:hypothetical protein